MVSPLSSHFKAAREEGWNQPSFFFFLLFCFSFFRRFLLSKVFQEIQNHDDYNHHHTQPSLRPNSLSWFSPPTHPRQLSVWNILCISKTPLLRVYSFLESCPYCSAWEFLQVQETSLSPESPTLCCQRICSYLSFHFPLSFLDRMGHTFSLNSKNSIILGTY